MGIALAKFCTQEIFNDYQRITRLGSKHHAKIHEGSFYTHDFKKIDIGDYLILFEGTSSEKVDQYQGMKFYRDSCLGDRIISGDFQIRYRHDEPIRILTSEEIVLYQLAED